VGYSIQNQRKGKAVINLDLAFFIQIINFGILVLVLNVMLYKPLRGVLDKRRLEIETASERTAAVDQVVQEKVALYEAGLRAAKAEAGARRAELLKEAQAEEAALTEKARKEAVMSLESIRERIGRESADARELLRKQADALSNEICEKILGRSL